MKVWLVGYVDEGYMGSDCRIIMAICLSKISALKKWEEIKQARIKDCELTIERDKRLGWDPRAVEISLKEVQAWSVENSPLIVENGDSDLIIEEMEAEP